MRTLTLVFVKNIFKWNIGRLLKNIVTDFFCPLRHKLDKIDGWYLKKIIVELKVGVDMFTYKNQRKRKLFGEKCFV